MDKKEFKKALKSLGHSKHNKESGGKYLFMMIDRDRSGRISEREFCEWWVSQGMYLSGRQGGYSTGGFYPAAAPGVYGGGGVVYGKSHKHKKYKH